MRAICGQKVIDKNASPEQMDKLGLKKIVDGLAKLNGVRWLGHMIRRDDDGVLSIA